MKQLLKLSGSLIAMLSVVFLLSTTPAASQTIPLKPCLEHFTASTCPPCGSWAPVFKNLLAGFEGRYTIIRYQMYWPGTGDPYYFAESKKRRDYYTVTGVPGLAYNGCKQVPYAQNFSIARMDSLIALVTGVQMGITASVDLNKIVTARITITPEIAYPAGLVAHIVVMEGVTTQNKGTNSEKSFNHVTMGFMPDATGTTLPALVPGQPVILTYTLDMKTTHMETANDLMVASFIQDNTNKKVIQSENADVSHPFTDYRVSLHVIDNDYNEVNGGNSFMPYYGDNDILTNGLSVYKGVFPGTYQYDIKAPGYDATSGEITVTNADVAADVMVEKPDIFFYEDFGWNTIPNGWNAVTTNGFGLFGAGSEAGSVVFYKPNAGDDNSYLVLPAINLTQSGIFSFRAGIQSGLPQLKVGIVTLVSEPGTDGTSGLSVTGFTELYSTVITSFDRYMIYGFAIPETIGNQRLAFKYIGVAGSFCEVDQVAVLEDNPGVKVQFLVTDQNDVPLKSTQVLMSGKTVGNNAYGYATFRDTDPGSYNYTVTYKNEEIATGILTVNDALVKQIKFNTSGYETIKSEESISIYPNPVKDQFTVNGISTGEVTVLTMNGQQLMKLQVRNGQAVATDQLAPGLYLVKIESVGKTVYHKMLLSR